MPTLTYNDMLGAYQQYPAPIRPYLLRAETHPALRSMLTKTFMRVFIDILARAPIADPYRALKLRIDIIAGKLDISEKSVKRTLELLRGKGWLMRPSGNDGRNNWGEFCASEYILGDELRTMLGLPTRIQHLQNTSLSATASATVNAQSEPTESGHSTPLLPQQDIANTDALIAATSKATDTFETTKRPVEAPAEAIEKACLIDQIRTEMSPGIYRVNKVFKKEASFSNEALPQNLKNQTQKTKPTSIPADLVALHTELGILPFGIFSLMQLAGQVKQRLQDVWQVKRQQILSSGATGGRAKRYLEFLLTTGEDFAYRARQQAQAKPGAAPAFPSPDSKNRSHYGKTFIGNNVQVKISEDGAAYYTDSVRTNVYIRPADTGPIFDAIAAGKLCQQNE